MDSWKKWFFKIDPKSQKLIPNNPYFAILFLVVIFFISQFISAFIVLIYPEIIKGYNLTQTEKWINSSIIGQFFSVLIIESIVVGSIILFLKKYKINFRTVGLGKFHLIDVFYFLLVLPIFYYIYFGIVYLLLKLHVNININQKQHIGFNHNYVHGPEDLILTFISLVILPPIAEELMFRGFLLANLRKIMPLFFAAIVTSMLFALPHLFEGGRSGLLWIGALETFILSLFLVYLRLKTKALYASMLLHASNNLIAFTYLYLLVR